MSNTVVLNFLPVDKYLFSSINRSQDSLALLLSRVKKQLSDCNIIAILRDSYATFNSEELISRLKEQNIEPIILTDFSNSSILSALPKGDGSLLYFLQGDAPFYDFSEAKKMAENHIKYGLQLSNGDGFPEGLIPEIISADILDALIELNKRDSAKKVDLSNGDSIFSLIMVDINSFDIDTILAEEDYSLLRVKLYSRGLHHTTICKAVGSSDIEGAHQISKFIGDNPKILRTQPAFYNIQINEQCPQKCSYCPYPTMREDVLSKGKEMSSKLLNKILSQAVELSDKAVISFSLWGEASLHSDIEAMILTVMSYPSLDLLIETSGIGWDKNLVQKLANEYKDRITWIISMDSDDKQEYQNIRGDGFEEAQSFAILMSELVKENCFIQAIRLKESEDSLVKFWERWNKDGQPLIQKYDNFCLALADKKVVDLSPIKRFPCWHLKRDINILVDGKVPLCREDLKCEYSVGDLTVDSLKAVFANGEESYLKQCNGEYNKLCRSCDEYYTFNF